MCVCVCACGVNRLGREPLMRCERLNLSPETPVDLFTSRYKLFTRSQPLDRDANEKSVIRLHT